ncbi:ergosterol biosynthesis protein [Tieghemiomyces parasiticus]|uniref:Ergosterol biosynthesis protein n=1 Tax=Tieghemiomyces parasiticus TaxID=78921 RepID=A0A9W8DQW8_9FUNG|nr:ergosterol biosynthesis protein [Tieghemiomyces parasiticus]
MTFSLLSWIPADGLLSKWLLFVSVLSVFNTAQAYFRPLGLTRRLYDRRPQEVTPLASRMFGCWTLVSAVVRFYGAYHLRNPAIYGLLFATYLIAFTHYATEIWVFRSASIRGPALSPVIVATCSLVWMWCAAEQYTGARFF